MKKDELISIAQEIGVGKISKKPRNGFKRKDAYNLFFSPREVRVQLPLIIPYLRMKRKQAELLLDFLKQSHWGKNGQGKGLTDEQISDRENLFQEMRKLNQRGVIEKIREQQFRHTPQRQNLQGHGKQRRLKWDLQDGRMAQHKAS